MVRPTQDVVELLALEQIEPDLFRAAAVFDDPYPLYGGQVAAQALRAAGLTVPAGRHPHSLHCYFLRGGSATMPTDLTVERDRDGRSYSARRVVARQDGKTIFTLSASFHVPEDGPDHTVGAMPSTEGPDGLGEYAVPRLASMRGRMPPQPHPEAAWPTRFWTRCTAPLPDDPSWHAAILTYVSDISTGLVSLETSEHLAGSSLDHSVWFHRPIRMDDWVLVDKLPGSVSRGRGWYTGTVHGRDGTHAASFAQEGLFRPTQGQGRPGPSLQENA
jgi:acyl-CoA thioesterase-2